MSTRPLSRVRWNLCALLLALLVLSWGYFVFSFARDYRTIELQCNNNLKTMALGLEAHSRQVVQTVDIILNEIARHYTHYSSSALQEIFSDWFGRVAGFSMLAVEDVASGQILFLLDNRSLPATYNTAAFNGLPGDETLQIAAQLYRQGDRDLIALARQFRQAERRFRVVAFLSAAELINFYQAERLDEHDSAAVFHQSGLLLARRPIGEQLVGRSFAEGPLFRDLLPHSPEGLSRAPKATDGIRRIVAHRKLEDLPLVVTVGTSVKMVFADWQSRLLNFLMIQCAVTVMIFFSLGLLFRTLSQVEKTEIALEEREEHFRSMANSSVDAVISVDNDDRIRFWSIGAERTFGCLSVEAIGMPISCFLQFVAEEKPLTLKQLAEANSPWTSGRTLDVQGQRKNGEIFPTELSVSRGTASGKGMYTLIVRDVSERKQMEERVRRMASHDNLTGLPNRGLLMDRLQVAMAQVRRQGGQFALLFIDLDQFKPVNDKYGHDAGDKLLQQVAKRMLEAVRASDTVARVGGDEFAILLTNVEEQAAVERACGHLLTALRRKFMVKQNPVDISCSIGVVLFNGQEKTAIELIGCADSAMYAAKRAGKNRYLFSKPED